MFTHTAAASELYDSLVHLQHRGQDAAGIVTYDDRFHIKRGLGLVSDVFDKETILRMRGRIGIGQTRYRTAGTLQLEDTPPFWTGVPYGVTLTHNGTLTNCRVLRKELRDKNFHHLNSNNDAEIILHVFAHGLSQALETVHDHEPFFNHVAFAAREVMARVHGAYSCIGIVSGKGMVVFRDPRGIRPLVFGKRVTSYGNEYIFASENSMFYALGFEYQGDVLPGEVIFIDLKGNMNRDVIAKRETRSCIFEHIYFARPDAVLNGVNVYRSRLYMGESLGKKWKRLYPDILPDIVVPAPFTANSAALSLAHEIGVRYSEGLYKNPFIGRTFIMPDQEKRKKSVKYKLSPLESEIRDKKVMIVDDSIVRGTTSRELVKIVRDFGAKEVYFVSASPPLINPCYYGIDIPTRKELIAANNSIPEIRKFIDADILMYQDVEDLRQAVLKKKSGSGDSFCDACLTGDYPTLENDDESIEQFDNDL